MAARRARAPRTAHFIGLALGAAGCGARHAEAPGAEEPVLHIYNWADYIGRDTIAEFERRTHIKVIYELYDSNDTLEAKMLAGHSGYDIVSTTTGFYGRQIKAGAYLALDKAKLPNWKNLDPAVLAIQAQADPGNRYAVPYLHSMNGFAYNVDLVKMQMPDAPTDSLAMIFDPKVIAHFAACGVHSSTRPRMLFNWHWRMHRPQFTQRRRPACRELLMAVRPCIRTFDSNNYWHQFASKEICLAIAWSSDYAVAQARAPVDDTGAHLPFNLSKEGSNIAYNALLIPASAPHPEAAHKFLNFVLEPQVIAAITNDIDYGNDNLAARPFVHSDILADPAVYPPPELRARVYLPDDPGQDYDRLRTRV